MTRDGQQGRRSREAAAERTRRVMHWPREMPDVDIYSLDVAMWAVRRPVETLAAASEWWAPIFIRGGA